MPWHNLQLLPTFDGDALNIVVDTAKGQHSKYKYDAKLGLFRFQKLLPLGQSFPFNFGFLPSTTGGDDDPLDVLLLGEEPIPIGTLVLGAILGVLEAEQTQEGKTNRNDRVLAAPLNASSRKLVQPEIELNDDVTQSIEKFFVTYNQMQGRTFKPLGTHGKDRALQIIRRAMKNAPGQKKKSRAR